MQGLCEQTVKVLRLMEAEGIEPNLIMLNLLINAFGIAGRHLEALSVFQHIKESVSWFLLMAFVVQKIFCFNSSPFIRFYFLCHFGNPCCQY